MSQLAIPVEVPLDAVLRKRSFGAAIELCVELSEMEPSRCSTRCAPTRRS